MNTKLKEVFRGKVVNKAPTFNTGVDEFPRYVVEYLIDDYCSEETFHQDMEKVVRRLKENFVHGAESDQVNLSRSWAVSCAQGKSDSNLSSRR